MNKIMFLTLLSCELMATGRGVYVGIDVGNTKMDLTISNATVHVKKNFDDNNKQFKIGYYFDTNNRFNGFYQYGKTANGNFGSLYGIGYDYLLGTNACKPFVGILLGHVGYSQSDLKVTGSFLGTQIGLNYLFGESVSIEAGYRYMTTNANGQYTTSITNVEVNTLKNWFIGVNYKF